MPAPWIESASTPAKWPQSDRRHEDQREDDLVDAAQRV